MMRWCSSAVTNSRQLLFFSTTSKCVEIPFLPPLIAKSNPRIREIKSALINIKKRKRKGDIYLEGHRLILDALLHGFCPEQVVMTQRAMDAPLGPNLLKALTLYRSKVSRVEENVIADITSTDNTQGVCAVFKKPTSEYSGPPDLVVLCDRIRDPGNLGSIIRSSYIFGADAVVVVEGCDAWSPKVLRSSMGYGMRFSVMETNWAQWMSVDHSRLCGEAADTHVFLADVPKPNEEHTLYFHANLRMSPLILVIGSESVGISEEARCWCPGAKSLNIPMVGRNAESLNAAAACAAILGEIQRQRSL